MSTGNPSRATIVLHGNSSIGKRLFPPGLICLLNRVVQDHTISMTQTALLQAELGKTLEEAKIDCVKALELATECMSCKIKGLPFEPAPATLELKNRLIDCVQRFNVPLLKHVDQECGDKLMGAFDKVETQYWRDHLKICTSMKGREEVGGEIGGDVGEPMDVDK